MNEEFKTFSQKPTQKFCEKLNNFEKPQIFNKNPKGEVKTCNAWRMSEKETYQMQRKHTKAEEHVGWRFGVRERDFGRWRYRIDQERSSKMKSESRWTNI